MPKYTTQEVFTPIQPATLAFVDRGAIAHELIQALTTPGKQIVLYGHSGAGKSSLLINALHQLGRQSITTFCTRSATFQDLLLDAFEQLQALYSVDDRTLTQTTAETLGKLLGAAKMCWVIEDINKLGVADLAQLAQVMNCFSDLSAEKELKIIAIGAIDTPQAITEFVKVVEIRVPPLNDREIEAILRLGEERLNIVIPTKIKRVVVEYADGLTFVCHELGRRICHASGIYETQAERIVIELPQLNEILYSTPRTLI